MNLAQINIQLDFNQVLDLVKQLPTEQQKLLAGIINSGEKGKLNNGAFSEDEKVFLKELDDAVDFVNNYPANKPSTTSFKQMLDAL